MIDIHCHILPGMDDGPEDVHTALKMARLALRDGVKVIIATPHCYDGIHDCQDHDIVKACVDFNHQLNREQIPLNILPGAEVRLTSEFLKLFEKGRVLTLGNRNGAVLLELPEIFITGTVLRVIKKMAAKGVRCILAHPEKNSLIHLQNAILDDLLKAGAELQFAAESLTGGNGRQAKALVHRYMGREGRCYIASEGHCARFRKPVLAKAVKCVGRLLGREAATAMVCIDLKNSLQHCRGRYRSYV